LNSDDKFTTFLANLGTTRIREMQRNLANSSVKPSDPDTSNGAASIDDTPQAVGNVNHGTPKEPQLVQGPVILEKFGTNGTDETNEMTQPQDDPIKPPVVKKRESNSIKMQSGNKQQTFVPGGYYVKARCIQESEIAHAPPSVREIWDWLIKEANHKNGKKNGTVIERGQCIRSYKDIQNGLAWYVGWRKITYSKNDCETAMRWLTKRKMVHTTKTTRGLVITVINYDTYQNPKNYETDKEPYKKHTMDIQSPDTINKNNKEEKKEMYTPAFEEFWKQYPKKVGKGGAFKFWESLGIEKNGSLERVMSSVSRNVPLEVARGDIQYVPNPQTWLNASGWEDEPPKKKERTFV